VPPSPSIVNMDPSLQQQAWDLGVKFVNAANAIHMPYASTYGSACNQVIDGVCTKLAEPSQKPSQRTPLSSKAQAFVPPTDSGNSKTISGWMVSITPMYMVEQLPSLGGTEGQAPKRISRANSRETVQRKDNENWCGEANFLASLEKIPPQHNLKQPFKRATTTRGRKLEQVFGHRVLPSRMPSRTPSPDSGLYSGEYSSGTLDSHVSQLPVKNGFIHYDEASTEDDDSSLDAEMHSGTTLKRSSSAPCLLMQHPVFELISPEAEESDAESTKLETSRLPYEMHLAPVEMQLAHASGTCHPCAYYYQKEDSCRLGVECKFCHLCPPDAVKKLKKMKLKARRRETARRRGYWENRYRHNSNKLQ